MLRKKAAEQVNAQEHAKVNAQKKTAEQVNAKKHAYVDVLKNLQR
jgi:hypothetical protein